MTVDLPQRTEVDTPVPGSSPVATRTEELIIKEARRRHRRRLLAIAGTIIMLITAVGIAAVNLAGHGSSAKQSSPLSTPLSTRPSRLPPIALTSCQNGQLRVTALSGAAGAGSRREIVGFFNISKASCTVTGYPVVVALDAQGAGVTTAEPVPYDGNGGVKTGAAAAPTVTLKPGQFAAAFLGGSGIPHGTATSCPDYPSFLVTPPDQTRSVKVTAWGGWEPGPFPGCSPIGVSPVVPGTSGDYPLVPSPIRPSDGKPLATIPSHGVSGTTTTP